MTDPADHTDFALAEVTVSELASGMEAGRLTAVELVRAYLGRIAALDREGPGLHAVIETNPDALAEADRLDGERAAGRVRGPLHGLPVLLKDNVGTADRMTTTAGSLALEGVVVPRDATVVTRLRAAGAVLLGKANLSEWANFRSAHSVSGWSARGGQCRNPYALDRSPCGSSSGSAVAVSANLAPIAVGTETAGSIVCPAAVNGVVGIKPTLGLVSRAGLLPVSPVQDTAGPLARTVRDAALLLGVMAGPDAADPTAVAPLSWDPVELASNLDADALGGARIGVARGLWSEQTGVAAVIEEALTVLRAAGATLVDPVAVPGWSTFGPPAWTAMLFEFKAGIETWLAQLGSAAPVRSLAELIAFNEAHADEEMAWFGQDIFEEAAATGPLSSPAYRMARESATRQARDGIDRALEGQRLDALVAPTADPAWVVDPVFGNPRVTHSDGTAAVAGYPNVTVPAGFVHGLPVGLSFFGAAWSEPHLLSLAYAFEQATGHRRRPSFLATLPDAPG